jgi:hypothetical protein
MNPTPPPLDYLGSKFPQRACAAILLRVPSSGMGWLDEMIAESRRLDATPLPAPDQPLATAVNSAPSEAGSTKSAGGEIPRYFKRGRLIWRFMKQGRGHVRYAEAPEWDDSDFDSQEDFNEHAQGTREITAEEGEP